MDYCISLNCIFHEIPVNKNSVDPDQTPANAASELGLHCLHQTPKRIPSLKRVN